MNVPALGMSVALGAREPIERMLSVVRRAEAVGVEAVWVIDSQLLYRDAYALMAVLAYETERIHIGPGVTNLLTRHETVIANALATLTTFAPDRIVVGLGTGDSSIRPLGIPPMRLADFASAVQRLRALLSGEQASYNGKDVALTTRPANVPPLFVAATQPRMLRTAGAIADGVILLGPADRETISLQLAHVEAGARDAARDPAAIQRDVWVGLSIGEGAQPIDDVRSYASTQARVLADWKDLPASLVPYRAELTAAAAEYDYSGHLRAGAQHAHTVSDAFVQTVAIAGSPDVCRDRLEDLFTLGLDRVSVTLLPGGREQRIDAVGALWESLRR